MANKSLYLIDSSIYIYRSWYSSSPDYLNQQGQSINALVGYTEFLFQLLSEQKPDLIACAFDGTKKKLLRNEIYPAYKANRDETPALLKPQFEMCLNFSQALGLPSFISNEYEADDIIGTLSKKHQAHANIVIVSKDKDLAQFIYKPEDAMYEASSKRWQYEDDIYNKHGVYPNQIADFLALRGDAVDNIPGLPGVGEKTAVSLMTKWGSIDGIKENIDHVANMKFRGAKKIKSVFEDNAELLTICRKLSGLYECPNLPEQPSALTWQEPDLGSLIEQFSLIGFSTFRQQRWLNLIDKTFS
jgi:5'-3' exonuclease